jgi:NAD(P)-dependent dehydrogenase (short-subunit alcohol dehydrogenase family)
MPGSKWSEKNIADQSGRIAIVTGSTSGIGLETARALAEKNARVIMAVRNVEKGERIAREIRGNNPGSAISVGRLDLTDLSSVKAFAEDFSRTYERLDLLINNAGIMMCPYAKTKDDFEIQMGTNHLGHFALSGRLMPVLKDTPGSRIVSVSSIAHRQGNIDFEDIHWEKRKYDTQKAYCDSKIANLYFTYEFSRKFEGNSGAPMAMAAHPGWTGTDLQRHKKLFQYLNYVFAQQPPDGALPTLRAAVDPEARAGSYYGPAGLFELRGAPVKVSSTRRSRDKQAAGKLWELSGELTGVSF